MHYDIYNRILKQGCKFKIEGMKKMNAISSYQNTSNWYTQNSSQTTGTNRTHHHRESKTLDNLVSAGTITQDQEKAIEAAFQSASNATQTSSSSTSDNKPVNPLDSLVKSGAITQDQENSIQNAFEAMRHSHHAHQAPPAPPEASNDISVNPLDSLVAAGTITQDQEKSIQSAIKSAINAYQAQLFTSNNTSNNSFQFSF